MALDWLFNQVKDAITSHSDQQQPGYDSSGLMNTVQGLFGQHAENTGQVLSADQDPYGDPADQQIGNVAPASQDPYGDPADQQIGNVAPASQDPYGDPADQQ